MVVKRSGNNGQFHVLLLLGSVLVLLMGVLLSTGGRRVFFQAGDVRIVLPETCALKSTTGIRCAGCGLTRSTIRLLEGKYAKSLDQHRLGWLVVLVIVLQIPYRLLALTGITIFSEPEATGWLAAILMMLLLGNWLLYLSAG